MNKTLIFKVQGLLKNNESEAVFTKTQMNYENNVNLTLKLSLWHLKLLKKSSDIILGIIGWMRGLTLSPCPKLNEIAQVEIELAY